MRTETLQYGRTTGILGEKKKTKGKSIIELLTSKNNLAFTAIAFLLGRAFISGGMMPFGISFFAAAAGANVSMTSIAISVLAGMLTAGAGPKIFQAAACMALFSILDTLFKNKISKHVASCALLAFASSLLPELIPVFINGYLLFDILKAFLFSSIVFLLVFIFANATLLIENRKSFYTATNERIISFAITMALAIAGLGTISILGINIRNIFCILIILILSYKSGVGVGAAIGVVVGLIVNMSGNTTPLIIGSYAFCGLLSGLFRNLGKVGSCLGFVMGNAMLTLYLNGSTDILIHLGEIVAAVIVFMITPNKFIDFISSAFIKKGTSDTLTDFQSTRVREITAERLNKFGKAYGELAATFTDLPQTSVTANSQDITVMFDRIADKVCKDCSLCRHCWDRNFYETYQVMFKIVERLEAKGWLGAEDIPQSFLDRCERVNEFVNAINNEYEVFKLNMVWKNRLGESRRLISQQLEGLSKVIYNLASEISENVRFRVDLEDALMVELDREGIKVNEVSVIENRWGKYEVTVSHKGCGGRRNCINTIEKVISAVMGRKMVKESNECFRNYTDGSCAIKFVEEEAFRVTTGVARIPKHKSSTSGDSYTFFSTGDGKYIAALSDGMGSGQKAAMQSRVTINLLEQLMESGFDKDLAVKMINSILALRSGDDSFSTVDMSIIDLYEGKVEFVKVGAVPTYIKRPDRVEVVKSASLPAGLFSNIDVELVHKKVNSGDFVIMVTDGIEDCFGETSDYGKSLKDFIQSINSTNPQEIADLILDRAYKNSNGMPADDMSVIVAKVWESVKV
ncbi:MAG TPA: stage II sporulation protein E [Clostridiaceae bacterium]|nr:stage II sporulation protein E [Clostridiaceae bacterium]